MKKFLFVSAILFLSAVVMMAQGKVSSKVYFNYSYNSDNTPTNSFEINRVYLTYANNFSKTISFKVTSDVGRFNTGKDNRLNVYLKVAALSWKTDFGKFVLGLQGMNMFNVEEHNWGYRFVEKAPMDKNHFSSSADLGLGYYYTFANSKFSVNALVTNGSGYKKSENDDYKKFSFQALYGDSKIAKGGYNIGASFSVESFDYTVATDTSTQTKSVFGGFAAYSTGAFRIGAEYDYKNTGGSDISETIISAYANYKFSKAAEVFGRFDVFDPNTNVDDDGYTYIVGGFNFMPTKGFSIAPNIKVQTPQVGDAYTSYFLNFEYKI